MDNFGTPAYEDQQMVQEYNKCEDRLNFICQIVRSIFRIFRDMNLWCRLLDNKEIRSVMDQMNEEKNAFQLQVTAMENDIRAQLDRWSEKFNRRDPFAFQINLRFQCAAIQEDIAKRMAAMKAYVKEFQRSYHRNYDMIRTAISLSSYRSLVANDNPTHTVSDRDYTISNDTITLDDCDGDDCVFLGYPDFPKRKRN